MVGYIIWTTTNYTLAATMNSLTGNWKVIKTASVRMGNSVLTMQSGAIVAVTQEDKQKILLEIGPCYKDWVHNSWLKKYCERN